MKQLWIINHYARKPSEGVGSRHYSIALKLYELGIETTLFTSSYDHFTHIERISTNQTYLVEDVSPGFKLVYIRTRFPYTNNGLKRILNMLSFYIEVQKVAMQFSFPQAIIGSSVHLFSPLAAYRLSKRLKCTFATEIRDLWPLTLIELGKMKKWHPLVILFGMLEKHVYRNSDLLISTLPNFKSYCDMLNIKKPIYFIPNFYTPVVENYSEESIVYEQMKALKQDCFIAIYLGAHGLSNNLDVILEAAQYLKSYKKLAIIMVGEGSEKKRLMEKACTLKLDNIYFYDYVCKIQLGKIIDLSDVGLVALADSVLYSYGISLNKLNDYLYYKKPVILSGYSPNNLVEISGCGVCVPPNDPILLGNAILEFSKIDHSILESMGEKGYHALNQYHTLDKITSDYLEVVHVLLQMGDDKNEKK